MGLEAEAETLIPYDSMAEPVVGPMEIHCNIVQSFVTTLNTHTVTNNKSVVVIIVFNSTVTGSKQQLNS